MKYAFEYGADAVYCGIPDFSLRARINFFGTKEVLEGIRYAHRIGKKVYITTNIFAHNKHIDKLPKFLNIFKKEMLARPGGGPDAFIASDPGVIATIRKILPKAKIHLSTQANCTNWQAAEMWYKQGVKRVVLAREVSLKEIKEIKKRVPKLELEYFVHGAMCMAYSGRCLLSAWMAGRSANLGDCAQSCRWRYKALTDNSQQTTDNENKIIISEEKRGEPIELIEDEHGSYIMNSKDLCLVEYLKDLKNAGVDAFKIEGRAKSVHYVATVVKAYRSVIDSNYNKKVIESAKEELNKNVNREYTTGFLLGNESDSRQNIEDRSAGSDWEFVGQTVETSNSQLTTDNKNKILVKPHNALYVGEEIEILQPRARNIKMKVEKMINATNGAEVASMHGGSKDLFIIGARPNDPARMDSSGWRSVGRVGQKVEPMSVIRKLKKN